VKLYEKWPATPASIRENIAAKPREIPQQPKTQETRTSFTNTRTVNKVSASFEMQIEIAIKLQKKTL